MANTLTFANQTLTDANIFGGINFLHDLNTGDEFTIGNTASASVNFVTDTQLPLYSKDGTNGKFAWTQNSTSRGTYYITEVTKTNGMYEVTAYDAMILLDTNISALSLSLPMTVSAIASAIATYIGCTVSGTVTNGSLSVSELSTDLTCRQLLHYVAEASGCSVKIDGSGHLCFMYYASSGITVSATNYVSLEVADYTCAKIDNVTIYNTEGDLQAQAGSGSNALYIGSNPLLDGATNTNATNILNVVKNFQYAPFKCEMFDENGLEIGTMATFGSTTTMVMHIESSETGAQASAVGSDSRAEYNKDILTVVNETSAIAVNAQTLLNGMSAAAIAANTTLTGIYQDAEDAKATTDEINAYAETAQKTVTQILNDGETAGTMAQQAIQDASTARTEAGNAQLYANTALTNLGLVEDVIGTLNWIQQHGYYELSQDDSVIANKIYYTVTATAIASPTGNPSTNGYYERSGAGTEADPYIYALSTDTTVDSQKTYYTVNATTVANPTGNPNENLYYDLSFDTAMSQYVNTHLALTDAGLSVMNNNSSGSMLLSTDGVTIKNAQGITVGKYGEGATIGALDSQHISIVNGQINFWAGTESIQENLVAYVSGQELHIPRVVVVQSLQMGNWRWDATLEGHLSLNWIGE